MPPFAGSVGKQRRMPRSPTQGHVLRVGDLLATLAVKAAIHHLEMIVELDRSVPRRTLTSSAGSWDRRCKALLSRAATGGP